MMTKYYQELLLHLKKKIKTGFEFCDSKWQNSEAEVIALQTISACAFNLKCHGEPFSWQGDGTKKTSGGGIINNPHGVQLLLNDKSLELVEYQGDLKPPKSIVHKNGHPMIFRVMPSLLHYAASILGGE